MSLPPPPVDRRTLLGQVLVELGRWPDGRTCRQLAEALLPREARPYRTADERREELDARKAHRKAARRRVSKALEKATELGLVEPAGRMRLSPSAAKALEKHGWAAFEPRNYVEVDGDIVGIERTERVAQSHRRTIVECLAQHPHGLRSHLLAEKTGGRTPAGNERGPWRRALRRLQTDGDVIGGDHRTLTAVGASAVAPKGAA